MDATSTPTPDTPAEPARTIPVLSEHVGVRPGYCGGKPHLLGHRSKVKHIAVWYDRQGLGPSEIVEQHPTITLAQVHAALACYSDHRAEIEAEIAEEDRMFEGWKARQPSLPDKIRRRKSHAPDHPIPPG